MSPSSRDNVNVSFFSSESKYFGFRAKWRRRESVNSWKSFCSPENALTVFFGSFVVVGSGAISTSESSSWVSSGCRSNLGLDSGS